MKVGADGANPQLREKGRTGASGRVSVCRLWFGVYVHCYTRHSAEEVLDDGLSGIPAEDADGAHTRPRPDSDPAPLNRGGSVLRGQVSQELTLPVGANGLEQALDESPGKERDELSALLEHAISDNTRRNYQSQWRRFQMWTKERNVEYLPANPAQVTTYLEERFRQGCSSSTLRASLSAISYFHRAFREDDPCGDHEVRGTLSGATRLLGRTQKQAAPLTREVFERILKELVSNVVEITFPGYVLIRLLLQSADLAGARPVALLRTSLHPSAPSSGSFLHTVAASGRQAS